MNPGNIIEQIIVLVDFFRKHCRETSTLDELRRMALDREKWPNAHAKFNDIRTKTLKVEQAGHAVLTAQYLFEEILAKTLYNLSYSSAPFDADSPFFIIPNAIALAKAISPDALAELAVLLGIADSAVRQT